MESQHETSTNVETRCGNCDALLVPKGDEMVCTNCPEGGPHWEPPEYLKGVEPQ